MHYIDKQTWSRRNHFGFFSTIPWVSFTSFSHPMQLHPADSVPRLAWGKYFKESDILKMPLRERLIKSGCGYFQHTAYAGDIGHRFTARDSVFKVTR